MIDPTYLAALVKSFHDLHGCQAVHVETEPVIERFRGKTVWEGDVEVFALTSHPKASKGYAWAYDKAKGSEIVAVLELPPVISPRTAVQASIAKAVRIETARKEALQRPAVSKEDFMYSRPDSDGVWRDGDGDPI